MTDFQRDLEVIVQHTGIKANEIRFNMSKYQRIEPLSIAELDLTQRAYHVCRRNGINTMGDLVDKWEDIQRFRQSGEKTNKELKNKLLTFYYGTLDEEERKQFWRDMDVA